MTSLRRFLPIVFLAAWLLPTIQAVAKLTPAEIDRLGKDLTLAGAEQAGNKDGSIPAFEGGLTAPPSGWTPEMGYIDPFPGDKPLFTITADNAEQYKDRLTAGEWALLHKYPNFRMPVYTSRRSVAFPNDVLAKAKAQADQVAMDGYAIQNLGGSYIPFPIPKTGIDVMTNHTRRYFGGAIDRTYDSFPVRGNGDSFRVGFREQVISDDNFDVHTDNHQFSFYGFYTSPATLEGTIYLVHEPIDQVKESRQAWIYNAGQRRVRRAPELGYDSTSDGTESMRTTDQYGAFNGALDRYDWVLVGKKEIYIPYNAYKLASKSLKYTDFIDKSTIRSEVERYELHRVWVVEATLKSGQRHVYGRRTFYVDEDSWSVSAEDSYDTKGQLWRIGLHPIIECYDVQVPIYTGSRWYDLTDGAYLITDLDNEVKTPIRFGAMGKWEKFQPDALRRAGIK